MGWFLFGGSDFILLFQKKAVFMLNSPKEGTESYGHLGERYGQLSLNAAID
jgi:phosphatidylserine decarboxylase